MTAHDLVEGCAGCEARAQLLVNAFVDAFRRADLEQRTRLVHQAPEIAGAWAGLVSAVVSALCRETGTPAPDWVRHTASPAPWFAFGARGFALRLRLMLESPPAFRARNVFVPANYLERA